MLQCHRKTFLSSLLLISSSAFLFSCESEQAPETEAAITEAQPSCGAVTIAEMSWNSASLMANVDKFILQHGYDCDAELVSGDTEPTGASMIEKGEPDIAPEMWSNSMKEALDKAVAEKRLRYAGESLSDGGEEGFWVPAYMVEQDPSLATLEGVKANAKLFVHPEDPDKSMLMTCPAGWNCQVSTANLYQALGLEDSGFALVDPGSGAALAGAIAKAYERKEPWFGYYWAPTAVLGKYKMVKVDFGSGVDKAHFMECISESDCTEPRATMYPPSLVQTVVTESFAEKSSEAYDYFTRRAFSNSAMNELLAWMEDNQADGAIAAEHFLKSQEAIWSGWVSEAAKEKIKAAL